MEESGTDKEPETDRRMSEFLRKGVCLSGKCVCLSGLESNDMDLHGL
jgi:hypothetical protein